MKTRIVVCPYCDTRLTVPFLAEAIRCKGCLRYFIAERKSKQTTKKRKHD